MSAVHRPSSACLTLAFAILGTACHESSSSALPAPAATTLTYNLGLALDDVARYASPMLLGVSEARQHADLNGDGDLVDRLAYVVDLEQRRLVNTGLAPGFPRSAHGPLPIVSQGPLLAFGVSEGETGNVDRNGDGDAADRVLALYERDTGTTTNLGFAVSSVATSHAVVAFDVAEADQGEDLDGDGSVGATTTVPFVHDRRSGATWNTGLRGARVRGVDADFVSLGVEESVVGDRNGDGDALDRVFELYDVNARAVQRVGLALTSLFGPDLGPVAHAGQWAIAVTEEGQGATDLDGDGDALDTVTFIHDPILSTTRNLGAFAPTFLQAEIEPFLLFDLAEPGATPLQPLLWLYEPATDALRSTGLRGFVEGFGERLLVTVNEASQGEDFDRNGALDSFVPVIYDLASGRWRNLGIDGFAQPLDDGLVLLSRESAAQRDWNRDGDRDDSVLFTWSERGGLVNTRLTPQFVTPLGTGIALVLMQEGAGQDLNGDGDSLDYVLEAYDVRSRRLANLGLAGLFLFEAENERALFAVFESEQGQDLNGDGDQDDRVLHLVEAVSFGHTGTE